jgi:hypothetical protein
LGGDAGPETAERDIRAEMFRPRGIVILRKSSGFCAKIGKKQLMRASVFVKLSL